MCRFGSEKRRELEEKARNNYEIRVELLRLSKIYYTFLNWDFIAHIL